jgi:hypothetical protein
MLAQDLFELRARLHSDGIIFAYCGYVTEQVLTGVGEALKQKLAIEDMETKTQRSVFAVFVEQMQNIIRYSAEKDGSQPRAGEAAASAEIRYGVMTVGRSAAGTVVKAGNLVERDDVGRLRGKLERVQKADKDELKVLYKEGLKAGPDEGSKGAGIGFIEIARRASKPIRFEFMDVDEQFAFFALAAEI